MEWIDAKTKKPEGRVFWALTKGRDECGYCDWEIIRLWNCENGDYRTLDFGGAFRLPGTYNGQSWYETIFAWLPLDAIPIDDKAYY